MEFDGIRWNSMEIDGGGGGGGGGGREKARSAGELISPLSRRCHGKKVYCIGDAESQTTMELVLVLVLVVVLDQGCEFEPHVAGVKDITV